VGANGVVQIDAEALEARHDGQVKAALASGPCALVIMSGAHDLSAAVRRAAGDVAYSRVTTRRFREAAGEEAGRR
jgi:hypothetical protein